jgi:hypothetical protein
MSPDQLVSRLLEQVEGSHFSLVRFVGRVSRHEWEWAPDTGIQSVRDVVANLVREETRVAKKIAGGGVAPPEANGLATPAAAAASLRGLRESTLASIRRCLPAGDDDTATRLVQSAVSLAQLDAHALGEIVMLQRLIDPSRATLSPR